MIHVSALHGTPLLVQLGALLASTLREPGLGINISSASSATISIDAAHRASLACNILSDASSLLGDDSRSRGVIGGSTLDGRTILVLADEPVEMLQGVMSVWAAGGVAMPVMAHTPGDGGWEASAILAGKGQRSKADEAVRNMPPSGAWIAGISGPEDADAVKDVGILGRYAQWVRDLQVDEEDRPAVVLMGEVRHSR